MDWVLYMVLKKMDLVFILASSILEAGKWARYGLGIIYGIKKDESHFHTGFTNSQIV